MSTTPSAQPEVAARPAGSRSRARRWVLRLGVAIVVLALVIVGLAPTIAGSLAPALARRAPIAGALSVSDASFSWMGPQRIGVIELRDPAGAAVGAFSVESSAGLFRVLTGSRDLGTTVLRGKAEITSGADGVTNLARALAPRAGAAASTSSSGGARSSGGPLRVPRSLRGELRIEGAEIVYRDAEIEKQLGGPAGVKNVNGSLTFESGQPARLALHAEPLRGGGPFDVNATATGLIGADGAVTPETAQVDLKATGSIDTALVDALAGLGGLATELSGGRVAVEATAQGGLSAGAGALRATGSEASGLLADVAFELKDGRLIASRPASLRATVTPRAAALLAKGEAAAVTLDRPATLSATIERLSLPLAKPGRPFDLRGATARMVVETSPIEGRAQSRAFALTPIKLQVDAPDLASGLSLAMGTTATYDGASAGTLMVDVRARELLDANGALRLGLPALEGEARATGVATALAQPFVESMGVKLARDVGPTVDVAFTARSNAAEAAGAAPTTFVASLRAAKLEARAEGAFTPSRLTSKGGGALLRAGGPATLLTALASKANIAFSGEGDLTVAVPEFDVPLAGGRPDLANAGVRAELEVGSLTARVGEASPIETKSLRLAGELRPGGGIDFKLAGDHAFDGKPFTSRADMRVDGLIGPGGTIDVGGARPAGAITLDGAPTSLAGMVATAADAALAADVLGPRVRLALSATPGDKGATSLGLEAVSDTLTARADAAWTPGASVAIGAAGASLRVEPAASEKLLRRFAPDLSGSPRLAAPATLKLAVDPFTLPFDRAGGFDLARAGTIGATLTSAGDVVASGIPISGVGEGRTSFDLGVRGLRAVVRSSLAAGAERTAEGAFGVFDPASPSEAVAQAEFSAAMKSGGLRASARIEDIRSERIDALLGRPDLLELSLGSPASVAIDAERATEAAPLSAVLGVKSPRLALDGKATLAADRADLAGPLRATWTMEERWANRYVTRAESNKGAALRMQGPVQLMMDVRSLSVGLGGEPMRPGVFALDARASAPVATIATSDGRTFAYRDIALSAASEGDAGLRVQAKASEATSKGLTLDARLAQLADGSGRLTTDRAQLSMTLEGQLPTALIDAAASGDGLIVEALGEVVHVSASADQLSRSGGTLRAKADSTRAKASLSGVVREGSLRADGPVIAELSEITPELGARAFGQILPLIGSIEKRKEDGPAAIHAEGLTLPLDGDMRGLNGRVTIELGKVQYAAAPFFGDLLTLASQKTKASLFGRWPPMIVSIEKGVATYERVAFPIGEFSLATEGRVDLVEKRAELVTWTPIVALVDEVANIANKVPGVTRETMFPLRTSGRLGKLKTEAAPDLLTKSLLDNPGGLIEDIFRRIDKDKKKEKKDSGQKP